jgi:hypothetical protein
MEIRNELEQYVIAWNKHLKDVVHQMDLIILLRNAHPSHRVSFAAKLLEQKLISRNQAQEFIRLVV